MKEQNYIKGLLRHDDKILRAIYKKFSKGIYAFIRQNGGTTDDAKDVFQDALMIIYKKAQKPDFELTSKFHTYLFSICKLTWYARQRKKSHHTVTIPDENTLIDRQDLEGDILERERHNIYKDNFKKLKSECQRLLKLFFEKKSMEEIATILKFKNEHTARTRKYRCQQSLKKFIEADKRFKEIQE